ncbi:unnamed protein product, partial [marine sediment metagenome]
RKMVANSYNMVKSDGKKPVFSLIVLKPMVNWVI